MKPLPARILSSCSLFIPRSSRRRRGGDAAAPSRSGRGAGERLLAGDERVEDEALDRLRPAGAEHLGGDDLRAALRAASGAEEAAADLADDDDLGALDEVGRAR